jgi:serine/threonine-protein kinase
VNWSAVERLFATALETPPEHRDALLDSHDLDETVRVEVRRLLARHDALSSAGDQDGRFLDALDLERATALFDTADAADPGTVGHYEIIRRLGRGATGIVYLARDPALDRDVALKLLSASLSADPTATRRFAEEARAASALDHRHIVTVYEFGRAEDGRFFIAMAYHQGETLRDRLVRGALPVEEAIRIAAEIADGLSAAHTRGIVHRDIKPENILLTPRGACIVDFGIAKVLGHTLTRTGAALGTAAYMSPEQTRGAGVDHRSDLWSLGVVLYEMLTGVRPFQAEGGEALVYGIRHDAPEAMTARQPGVAPAVAQVVDRCLEKDPERRYQSADALLSALRAPLPSSHGSNPSAGGGASGWLLRGWQWLPRPSWSAPRSVTGPPSLWHSSAPFFPCHPVLVPSPFFPPPKIDRTSRWRERTISMLPTSAASATSSSGASRPHRVSGSHGGRRSGSCMRQAPT